MKVSFQDIVPKAGCDQAGRSGPAGSATDAATSDRQHIMKVSFQDIIPEAGCDQTGRGFLAGSAPDAATSDRQHIMKVSFQDIVPEAGCDEAGRGCLAGPVFAAAVILPPGFRHPLLNDSKQMSRQNREILREVIEREAVAWAVVEVSEERIDRINILNASIEAMNLAVERLSVRPGLLAVDGNRFRNPCGVDFVCVVKGDSIYANIAAASVLAKTHRDQRTESLARRYPHYKWESNKGYPTRDHTEAIARHGLSPYHRRTFGPCADQLKLF